MEIYQSNIDQLKEASHKLSTQDKRISAIRLVVIVAAGFLFYEGYQTGIFILYLTGFIAFSAFLLLIKKHQSVRWKHQFVKEKTCVNQNEVAFINDGELPFDNGFEFTRKDHPYSYDLDFFGDHSLFQTLNRASTFRGKQLLAESLLNILPPKEVLSNQEAIKELSADVQWRQDLLSLGMMNPDTEDSYQQLLDWSKRPVTKFSIITRVLAFLLPIATLINLGLYFLFPDVGFGTITFLLFLINLGFLGVFAKTINNELIPSTKIEAILKSYAHLLKEIENKSFQSEKLRQLQNQLISNGKKASKTILQLSLLFGRMEHVTNAFASPLLNGFIQYHVHVLIGLFKWRAHHGSHISAWLDTVAAFEQLNSLANFSFNNSSFVFPIINIDQKINFRELGHPLLDRSKSVTNSIDFNQQRFFILTGSNMSGKSTFLRTIGINMVLAGIGAPVYAKEANVHPLPVLVSMRLSDSLTDSESYFYAEVKRLKWIMDQLDKEACFILLDEILRGTNSDDKQDGTIAVIRKMAGKHALGGIATHDLEVCKTQEEFPETLMNKRFEVSIVKDELVFDYKLQNGVCQNKSASFIMKKMGVV